MSNIPGSYQEQHLRSLQRRLKDYKAFYGENDVIIFPQNLQPGRQSQSDWTVMNKLNITIANQHFSHLLFHFMLPYSRWSSIMICYTESFDTLSKGYAKAAVELGGTLPEHRTDNLSAATKQSGRGRSFTDRWLQFLEHYNVVPSRNNPGQSNENGSVEKSHDLFKSSVNQHLLLRGSRNFTNLTEYELFLNKINDRHNQQYQQKLAEEINHLQSLPARPWNDPIIFTATVSPSSTVQILGCTYSVPSRLIAYKLQIYAYPEHIKVYYGQRLIITMPRIESGSYIDYRHIIDGLIRKPGAFANYQYRAQLFPKPIFRFSYDRLIEAKPNTGYKDYLKILQMAKCYGEAKIISILELCKTSNIIPEKETITMHLRSSSSDYADRLKLAYEATILKPDLIEYDNLHSFKTDMGTSDENNIMNQIRER